MKTLYKNLGRIIGILFCVYCIDRLCLSNDLGPLSIESVHTFMNQWVHHWHIIVVGLMPIYVALVFFAACFCGNCFGITAGRWLSRFFSTR